MFFRAVCCVSRPDLCTFMLRLFEGCHLGSWSQDKETHIELVSGK